MCRRATRLFLAVVALLGLNAALSGTALAGPVGMVCTNGPSFNLNAKAGTIETPDGNSVYMWGYANGAAGKFQLPGPVLCVNQGQTVTVTLTNSLPEPVSIVFPGQSDVSATGGSPGLLAQQATAGDPVTYTFTASNAGTYLYESGTNPSKQVEMGLYGALVVRPAGHPDWAYGNSSTQFDPSREYLLLFNEIDPALHHAVETGGDYDFTKLHDRYYMITGRAFPDTVANNAVSWLPTQPYGSLVRAKPFDAAKNKLPALVRMLNAGLSNHPFHPHGFHVRLIAQDGRMFLTPGGLDASTEHFGDVIASGSTQDALFTFVDKDHFCTSVACDGFPENALPVTLPTYRNLTFKDNATWYSGSPYLGAKGTLPTGVTSYNVCGEFFFPWHSHALNEFVNFDEPFGGMATLLRVDPLPGCTSYPTSTKIIPTPPNTASSGTLKGGTSAALGVDDTSYYEVNSTATATPPGPTNTFKADWYGGFTGITLGSSNLKVTYKGKCSATCVQAISIWNWRTSAWVQLDTRSVGPGPPDATTGALVVPPSPAGKWTDYIGTGTSTGQARVRVYATRTAGTFISSGNLMKLVFDTP